LLTPLIPTSNRSIHAGCCGKLLGKMEFGGESPQRSRARCSAFRYFPDPLGVATAKQLDKLEFIYQILQNHLKTVRYGGFSLGLHLALCSFP
jgi:hypothetical protein